MEKRRVFIIVLLSFLFSLSSIMAASTESCQLSAQLLNQDPYPAVPGDYVKLVFQLDGTGDSSCGDITFELLEKYPISFDPNSTKKTSLRSGTFIKDYSSHATIAYRVRVDSEAVDGENPIEVQYSNGISSSALISKQFNLSVEDSKTSFEVYVKNFDSAKNEITLEVLNIGTMDVQAVTLEMNDSNIIIKGPRTNIIGDLDSNEYTTANFEVQPIRVILQMKIYYTDSAGFRRASSATVEFDPSDFSERKAQETKSYAWVMWLTIIIIVGIVWWYIKKRKRK